MSLSGNPVVLGSGGFGLPSTTGDVDGPSSSTDKAIARFNGTTGKLIQDSVIIVADTTGAMSGWTTGVGLTFHGGGTLTGASGALTIATGAVDVNINLTTSGTGFIQSRRTSGNAASKVATTDTSGFSQFVSGDNDGTAATTHNIAYGSAVAGTTFGVNRANSTGLYADGSALNALLIGTIIGAPTVFGYNDTEVFRLPATNILRMAGTNTIQFGATALASIGVSANTTAGNVVFTGTTTGIFTFDKAIRGNGGFQGSAGTEGLTQASTATLGRSITVENGLITAFA